MSAKATRNRTIWSWAKRGRGGSQSRSAALPQHRVREPMLPENADHAAARPPSANRRDDEPGSRNVPISDTSDGTPNHSRLTCGKHQALRPIAIPHRAPQRELEVRFGGAVLPHGDRLQGPAAYPRWDSLVGSRLSRRRLRTRPAPSPGAATPSRSCRCHGCRRPGPNARRCRPDRDPAGAAPPPSSCSRP